MADHSHHSSSSSGGSSTSSTTTSSNHDHGSTGMVMTFFSSTRTPLFSDAWTPRSTAAYAGSCIFLIVLAVLFRCGLALRHRLERYWMDRHLNRRYVVVAGQPTEKARISTDTEAKTALLVSAAGVEEEVRVVRRHVRGVPPWRLSVDLPRAMVVTVLSGVGYLLMLAVMTFNVGYFLSVLGGVFLGDLAVGRFTQTDEH